MTDVEWKSGESRGSDNNTRPLDHSSPPSPSSVLLVDCSYILRILTAVPDFGYLSVQQNVFRLVSSSLTVIRLRRKKPRLLTCDGKQQQLNSDSHKCRVTLA